MSDKKQDWRGTAHDRVCSACMNANPKMGNCKNDCLMHKLISSEISAAEKRGEERGRAEEAAKYRAVVEAAKAFTSGGQAELCGACAYGRFNARKLSSALAALEGK